MLHMAVIERGADTSADVFLIGDLGRQEAWGSSSITKKHEVDVQGAWATGMRWRRLVQHANVPHVRLGLPLRRLQEQPQLRRHEATGHPVIGPANQVTTGCGAAWTRR